MLIILISLTILVLLSILLDFKMHGDPFSPFIWLLIIAFSKYVVPAFAYYETKYAEFLPNRIFEPAMGLLPASMLFLETTSFIICYLLGSEVWKRCDIAHGQLILAPRPRSQYLYYLCVFIFLIASSDLILHWLQDPVMGSLYYRMQGHGWANMISTGLTLYLFLPMLAARETNKKIALIALIIYSFILVIALARMTQLIRFTIAIAIILIVPFKNKKLVKPALRYLFPLVLVIFVFRAYEYFSGSPNAHMTQFLTNLFTQDAGLFQDLTANFYYAPEGFSLSPLLYFNKFPIFERLPFFQNFKYLLDGGVESWIFGLKRSPMGGMPFLALTQNYFTGGIPLVIFFGMIMGITLSFLSEYMLGWGRRIKEHEQDLTIGYYAVIWYIWPGFSIPAIRPWLFIAISIVAFTKVKYIAPLKNFKIEN